MPPEDVLHAGSDSEELEDGHHKKRRRIEELGQQYLEGKPLFIASASLRGPLSKGWVNPWAKKESKTTGVLRLQKEPRSRDRQFSRQFKETQNMAYGDDPYSDFSKDTRGTVISDLGFGPPKVANAARDKVAAPRLAWGRKFTGHTAQGTSLSTASPLDVRRPDHSDLAKPAIHRPARPTASELDKPTVWLKSDKHYLETRKEKDERPSTPTPCSRSSPSMAHQFSFTPINRRVAAGRPVTTGVDSALKEPRPLSPTSLRPHATAQVERPMYREVAFMEADEWTQEGHVKAKELSQRAVAEARYNEGYRQARQRSEEAALKANQGAPNDRSTTLLNQPMPAQDQAKTATVAEPCQPKESVSRPTPHQLLPSTNLTEFQYHLAKKRPTSSSETSLSNPTSFTQQMKAAKAKAEAQSKKRLSFTSSGRIKNFGSQSTSRQSSASPTRRGPSSSKPLLTAGNSHVQAALPEGQQVPVSVRPEASPLGPSLHKIANAAEEGDSYVDLSTQAAISKAQTSFQKDIITSLQTAPTHPDGTFVSRPSPTAYRTPIESLDRVPLSLTKPAAVNAGMRTPVEDAPSTQAMMDAISPFAVTTIKPTVPNQPSQHPKRTSFAHSPLISPSRAFGVTRRSLSMSTSSESTRSISRPPSPKPPTMSKPPSILSKASTGISKLPSTTTSTAFSIAPNGTLTEVYQPDGQQLYDVAVGTGMDGWDLDEAIEEAGSFLATGAWDVEAEARTEGAVAVATNANAS